MKWLGGRRERRDGDVVLASCEAEDGTVLAGTRSALYLGDHRIRWQEVEAADWDRDTGVWRVCETGVGDRDRRLHSFSLDDPQRFLALARERVTASVVLQRTVVLQGRRGFRVVARRAPVGDTELVWVVEYDEGIDPGSPEVADAVARELEAARIEVGLD